MHGASSQSHVIVLSTLLVNRIKEETKTAIIIPSDSEKKSLIRIEGSPQGVAKAKAEILEMAKKLVGFTKVCNCSDIVVNSFERCS